MNLRINTDQLISILSFIFVFVVMIDPPNTLLGLKNIAFGLLLLACLLAYRTAWKRARGIIAVVYIVISVSIITGYLQGFTFDAQTVKGIYKTYALLLLLLWINKLSLLEKMFFPALVIAFTTIIVYYLMTFYPTLEASLYSFFNIKYNLISISKRTFVGVNVLGIYYTSVALLIVPLALYLYNALFKKGKKIKYYCVSTMFLITLLFAGTRACMFSAVLLTLLMIIIRIYKFRAGKLVAFLMVFLVIIYSYNVIRQVLNDKNEISLQGRAGHIRSYISLVTEHPLILVLGEGAGSTFYSEGFKKETAQTEWSYAELVRWFGLFGAGIIVCIYLFPLYIFYRKRKILPYSLPMRIGYSFYLLIAGTNPLLLGSNGLLALLIMYSYAFNPKYEQHE